MLFFIVFLVVFGVIIWKKLPETKNKSFAEIAALMGIPNADENDNDKEIHVPLVSDTLSLYHNLT